MESNYRNLKVWQQAISLVIDIYHLTENLPKTEQFGLTSQIRRAAVSIASNIAEGSQKKSKADFVRFLEIAQGSSAEVETQLIII